jgi:hypothetical protein
LSFFSDTSSASSRSLFVTGVLRAGVDQVEAALEHVVQQRGIRLARPARDVANHPAGPAKPLEASHRGRVAKGAAVAGRRSQRR